MSIQDYPDWSEALQTVGAVPFCPSDDVQTFAFDSPSLVLNAGLPNPVYLFACDIYIRAGNPPGVVTLIRGGSSGLPFMAVWVPVETFVTVALQGYKADTDVYCFADTGMTAELTIRFGV